MTQSRTGESASEMGNSDQQGESRLPRRDWILLPLLGLLTACIVAGSAELIARRVFPVTMGSTQDCTMSEDPGTGLNGVPGAVCKEIFSDTPYTEYKLNNCGHRASEACGPKPAGTYRIVSIGSSVSIGMGVKEEETFAALLQTELSRRTGKRVEIYNEGLFGESPGPLSRHFKDVLSLQPDMIFWVLTPHDIMNASTPPPVHEPAALHQSPVQRGHGTVTLRTIKSNFASKPFFQAVSDSWRTVTHLFSLYSTPPSMLMLQHFLYLNQSVAVDFYLKGGRDAGFLRTQQDAEWQGHLKDFNSEDAMIEAQAKAAGVPLVAVLLPYRVQAAMISMNKWPAGFDPYKLDNQLRTIIEDHGGIYLDILSDLRTLPNAERYYYPVNGHPDAKGHAIFAGFFANALTSGAVPALRPMAAPQLALEHGR